MKGMISLLVLSVATLFLAYQNEAVAAEKLVWKGTDWTFARQQDGKTWEQSSRDQGRLCDYWQVPANGPYIEMVSKGKGRYRIRLYQDHLESKSPGEADWSRGENGSFLP